METLICTEEQSKIDQLVLRLISKYRIDYLFIRERDNFQDEGVVHFEIVILLANKESANLQKVNSQIEIDMVDYVNFNHVTFISTTVKEKLSQGDIFFFDACHPSRLLFKNPSCSYQLYPQNFSPKQDKKTLQRIFDRENLKINEFKEGFYFYKEKKSFALAAFMMHQVFELRFRCMEILFLGKEKPSHNIRVHHRALRKVTTSLNSLFCENNKEDNQLLTLLNEVYCAVRYEDKFQVLETDINLLESKMNNLISVTDQLFCQYLKILDKENFTKNLESTLSSEVAEVKLKDYPNHPFLTEILVKITTSLDIKQAYLVSSRSRQTSREGFEEEKQNNSFIEYILLLVSESNISEESFMLQSTLNGNSDYSVQLLGHSIKEVNIHLKRGHRFFRKVLEQGNLVFQIGNNIVWSFKNEDVNSISDKKHNKLKLAWDERMERVNSYLNGANTFGAVDNYASKTVVYGLALEQVFIGLLEFFYDYKPQRLSLKNVFNICAGIWKFPAEIFPNETIENRRIWKLLIEISFDIKLNTKLDINWSDLHTISDNCNLCIDAANELINNFYEETGFAN
ncbi:hypothetical protein ORI89_05630 [Sphingobacterium sp. UT-1RO-CII-1]|uniref:hypothetical protein n=1 Tax=Sphingobacterium sp. UT-1RO-CII-1 TaxID=2995225 RepID=UPI00227BCC40|nr:hypothetical protein [Sphingobacterium sp. UT-1RO-CII-1]MCY4779120.1 hypothetical protein [Sphingobacterium sp. UT-1RO-CII-1]